MTAAASSGTRAGPGLGLGLGLDPEQERAALVSAVREVLPKTRALYLFGSRASGEATPESDLLAVWARPLADG